MTSNNGTKKKAKTKSLSNGRRKKNIVERQRDVMDRDVAYENLYAACNKFFDEFGNYEGDYGEIGVMYYDQLRNRYNSANWVNKRLKEDYVSDNLHGCWETTTHSHIYTDST